MPPSASVVAGLSEVDKVPGAVNHLGVWLPKLDAHFPKMMSPDAERFRRLDDGRPTYQRWKYLAALECTDRRGTFVDVGAHVGTWSMQAERDFSRVVAFEPCELTAGIYPHNMRSDHYTLHNVALGSESGAVAAFVDKTDTGDAHVVEGATVPLRTLDSYELEGVDLIKIDVQGYELEVVKGAVDTLLRCKPLVVVEDKGIAPRRYGAQPGAATAFLKSLGMSYARPPLSGDFFLRF